MIIGPTSCANVSLGGQPVGMNSAVIRPQAMNAPMLGMIIAGEVATEALNARPETPALQMLQVGRRARVRHCCHRFSSLISGPTVGHC